MVSLLILLNFLQLHLLIAYSYRTSEVFIECLATFHLLETAVCYKWWYVFHPFHSPAFMV